MNAGGQVYQPVAKVADPAWPRRDGTRILNSHGNGEEMLDRTVVLGEMRVQGLLLKVNALPERMQLAVEAGAKRILIPSDNKRDVAEVPDAILTATQWQFFDWPTRAAIMALGMESPAAATKKMDGVRSDRLSAAAAITATSEAIVHGRRDEPTVALARRGQTLAPSGPTTLSEYGGRAGA